MFDKDESKFKYCYFEYAAFDNNGKMRNVKPLIITLSWPQSSADKDGGMLWVKTNIVVLSTQCLTVMAE